jgi:hypothetical protein
MHLQTKFESPTSNDTGATHVTSSHGHHVDNDNDKHVVTKLQHGKVSNGQLMSLTLLPEYESRKYKDKHRNGSRNSTKSNYQFTAPANLTRVV